MPFRSKKQMKACFATKGFNGKIDCHEWAHETGDTKKLPNKVKKQQGGGMPSEYMTYGDYGDNFIEFEDPRLAANELPPATGPQPVANQFGLRKSPQELMSKQPQGQGWKEQSAIDAAKEPYKGERNKLDPSLLLRGASNAASWLGNLVDRKRQDAYDMAQRAEFSRPKPQLASNFQPTHLSYYAKYGGKFQQGGQFGMMDPRDLLRLNQPRADATRTNMTLTPAIAKAVAERERIVNDAAKKLSNEHEQARRKQAIALSNKTGKFSNSAVRDKMRLFPDSPETGLGSAFDEYWNPLTMIGGMADDLGHANTIGEFAKATVAPLATGLMGYDPLGGGIKTGRNVIQAGKNLLNNDVIKNLSNIPERLRYNYNNNEFKTALDLQSAAPMADDNLYSQLRTINKAGNIYNKAQLPMNEKLHQLIKLNIPDEHLVRLTGKTKGELIQEAQRLGPPVKKGPTTPTVTTSSNVQGSNAYGMTTDEQIARFRQTGNTRPINPSGNIVDPNGNIIGNNQFTMAGDIQPNANTSKLSPNSNFRNQLDKLRGSGEKFFRGLNPNNIADNLKDKWNNLKEGYRDNFQFETVDQNYNSIYQNQSPAQKAESLTNLTAEKSAPLFDKYFQKKFNKQYVPVTDPGYVNSTNPSLVRAAGADVEAEIERAVREFRGLPKGAPLKGASSLSDGSFPVFMKHIEKLAKDKVGEPHLQGFSELNSMGFINKVGASHTDQAAYLNRFIDDLNKASGKNFPKAYVKTKKTGFDRVMYPDIYMKRLQAGGFTRGLIPRPTYNMKPVYPDSRGNLGFIDSSNYRNAFKEAQIMSGDEYNRRNLFPTLSLSDEYRDKGDLNKSQDFNNLFHMYLNAQKDTQGPMSPEQIQAELMRQFVQPPDTKRKKQQGGYLRNKSKWG